MPGLTVDVYANGEELLPDFEPGTLTDPLRLPAGSYDLQVFADGDGPDGEPAVEANGVEVPAGANATEVRTRRREMVSRAPAAVTRRVRRRRGEARRAMSRE